MDSSISDFLKPGKKVHLSGIGGVSMTPLAINLFNRGLNVQGSDVSNSRNIKRLKALGLKIADSHSEDNINDVDCVIRTAAVHDDNPEIIAARKKNIPVFERAQAWGEIMKDYSNAVCVAGTHGKTTTTALLSAIFINAGLDPSIMIGGELPLLNGGYRIGKGDTILLEACEYFDSFLSFFPSISVLLSVDTDHLDYFKTLDNVKKSFRKFAELAPEDGYVVANLDDSNTMDSIRDLDRNIITFGLNDGKVHTRNLTYNLGCGSFDVYVDDDFYTHVDLSIPGDYNVQNALAACATAYCLNIPGEVIQKSLKNFFGAQRRFERKGTFNGAAVYDDYAHHPNELNKILSTSKKLGYKRVVCAFQPHTFTRTYEHLDEFAEVLKIPDVSILMEIYPAREINEFGISSKDISDRVPESIFCKTLDEVADVLADIAEPGDLILTVGAGDIYISGEKLVKREKLSLHATGSE